MPSALANVRVLDFTRVLAGPFCTMLLADLGADVIKVESLDGDETRQWGPPFDAEGRSAYYLSVNRNKRSLTLNLKSAAGQQIARQLAADSQIVVENLKPGGMAAFSLGFDDLRALNPALVYASISGFGQTGPYSDRPGYDFVIQAMSGLMSITGEVEGAPSKVGVAIADVVAGLFASSSILAALRHAERTGEGQHLDIALLDTQIAALVNIASSALVSGQTPKRYGNAHPSIVPYQTFRAADAEFALAVGNDRQFAQLCRLIDREEWTADPRFATNPARVANRAVLIALLDGVFVTRPAVEWVAGALELGIPAGTLNTVSQMLEDQHVQARGLIHVIDNLRLIGNPVGFSATPPSVRTPPPDLGEHTDAILRERLGLTDAEIAAHRASGVI
ncbi:MAG: CoA transferase [Chloroflexi bacterium]|nr:CoA transferase [Chloroflexota bacterium]